MKLHEYSEQNLRAASPEKCNHPVGGKLHDELSYGTVYFWYVCPLCHSRFNQGYYQNW